MAREFAKAFYNSTAWQSARDGYISSRLAVDGGMCELCGEELGEEVHHRIFLRPENIDGPEITLNPENFLYLCRRCHHMEHEAAARAAWLAAKKRDGKNSVLINGDYWIDDQGETHPFRCVLVWGCPGAGKTTYVREHMQPGDAVIDLDLIGRALSLADKTDVPRNIERIAYDIRDFLYSKIAAHEFNARTVWVVASAAKRAYRAELIQKLGAEPVFIPADFRTCYQHVLHDGERIDKALQLSIIEKWFKDFEPDG